MNLMVPPRATSQTRSMAKAGGTSGSGRDDDFEAIVISIRTEPNRDIRVRARSTGDETARVGPDTVVSADRLAGGLQSFAESPEALLELVGSALWAAMSQPDPAAPRWLLLSIGDEDAARWPWELATIDGVPVVLHPGVNGVLRQHTPIRPEALDEDLSSRGVVVAILVEHRDRGHAAELLDAFYGADAELIVVRSIEEIRDAHIDQHSRLLIRHLITKPVEHQNFPALELNDGSDADSKSIAAALGERPQLVILDPVLSSSNDDAAEQIMAANALCWRLMRRAPEISILCGVFAGANDRVASLRLLAAHLAAGNTLATTVGDLQRFRPVLPGGRHPLRDVVSLNAGNPHRRVRLSRSA
jgi:hypothetical protein